MSFFRNILGPIQRILPEVPKPIKKLSLNTKILWTGLALIVYLIMAEIPLYGVGAGGADQLAYTRIIFASKQGTLMELGIGPIVTAGLIMQLLKGAEIIKLDFKKPEDRALFTSATKFLTMIVILVEALAFIIGGAYTGPGGVALSSQVLFIILIQLFAGSFMVLLLDELIQKGWGLGSGISLFILAGVAQSIMWSLFSPLQAPDGAFGFIPFTIGSIISGNFQDILIRPGVLPSLVGLITTIIIILIIIYLEGMRVEIPITSMSSRGFAGTYPIKLLYVSVLPVILVSALFANITFAANLIWSNYNPQNVNPWLNWLVMYDLEGSGNPIGGLIYYITSPQGIQAAMGEPIRALTFSVLMIVFCILFAKLWVEVAGLSSREVAKNLLGSKVQVPGFRRSNVSVEHILSRYIPIVTVISGAIIGVLAATSDLLGVFGTGTGLLLMIGIILQYYQILTRERLEEMMPRLGALLGKG
jgi:preprotein translocase SecY subunit